MNNPHISKRARSVRDLIANLEKLRVTPKRGVYIELETAPKKRSTPLDLDAGRTKWGGTIGSYDGETVGLRIVSHRFGHRSEYTLNFAYKNIRSVRVAETIFKSF